MNNSPFVFSVFLLSSCASLNTNSSMFHGTFDESYFERYSDEFRDKSAKEECEAETLYHHDIIDLIEEYEKVDSYFAHQTLIITPCLFEGEIVYKKRVTQFLWYPTGYLRLLFPNDEGIASDYYICVGTSDEDGVYECD